MGMACPFNNVAAERHCRAPAPGWSLRKQKRPSRSPAFPPGVSNDRPVRCRALVPGKFQKVHRMGCMRDETHKFDRDRIVRGVSAARFQRNCGTLYCVYRRGGSHRRDSM